MKFLYSKINRFCARHENFGIKNLMLYIAIGNACIFILNLMDTTNTLLSFLAFNFNSVCHGEIWRLITFIFVPTSSSIIHELLSLLYYYWIGSTLERIWGTAKFTVFYLSSMLETILYGAIASLAGLSQIGGYLTAYYINLSMFFIFALYYPEAQVRIFYIIPIKIKWVAIVEAVFFAISALEMPYIAAKVLPFIPVFNVLVFCWNEISGIFGKTARRREKRHQFYRIDINNAEQKTRNNLYTHKCEICGRSDADYKDLEFRYCSKCEGYHCFCSDHIGNHTHFTAD